MSSPLPLRGSSSFAVLPSGTLIVSTLGDGVPSPHSQDVWRIIRNPRDPEDLESLVKVATLLSDKIYPILHRPVSIISVNQYKTVIFQKTSLWLVMGRQEW